MCEKTYFVSRHPGAVEWASRRGLVAVQVKHMDVDMLCYGDTVIGTLPVHLAAAVCARGARYLHLVLRTPESMRGQELDANQLESLHPKLTPFHVQTVVGE